MGDITYSASLAVTLVATRAGLGTASTGASRSTATAHDEKYK